METGLTSNRSFEMSRSIIIAGLISAAALAAAPSYAQTSDALLNAKVPRDAASPLASGVAPRVSPFAAATKGATSQEPLSNSTAPALQQAPESALLKN